MRRWLLLFAAVLAGLIVPAGATDLTPDWGRTPAEARALDVAESHFQTAYTLSAKDLEKARRKAQIDAWLHFGGEVWVLVGLLGLLGFGVVASMERVAIRAGRNRWLQGVVFVGLLVLAETLLDLPLAVAGHHVSRVYGLSVQGWGCWTWDQTKGLLLTWGLGWPIVLLLFLVIRRSPRTWWLWFWMASIPIVLIGMFLLPLVIEPLFERFEPLASSHPALVEQIERVAAKGQLTIPRERMFLMKASDKVTGLNAYVTGFGSSKRVVVWDTTIAKATPDELLFIVGHEMGHYVLGHIVRGLLLAIGGLLLMFGLGFMFVQTMLKWYGPRWGIRSQNDWGTLAVLLLGFNLLSIVSEPIDSTLSRVQEHEADVFGQEVVHGIVADPQKVGREAFQLLGETSLDEPLPSPLLEFWTYGHPSISRRAAFAEAYDPWAPGNEPRYLPR